MFVNRDTRLTSIVEEAHVTQNKPSLLPHLHPGTVLQNPAAQQPSIKPADQSQCSTESPTPIHVYFPQISLLCLLLFSGMETLSLFEAWIIFIFLPCALLFVELMFAPCKHVYFNSDNKAWWFCLCCGSSFDGGCLGKRRDHPLKSCFSWKHAAFKGTLAQRSHTQRGAQLTDTAVTLCVFISICLLWEAVVKYMMQKHKTCLWSHARPA